MSLDEQGQVVFPPVPFTWTPAGDSAVTIGELSLSPTGAYMLSMYETESGEVVIVIDLETLQETACIQGGQLFTWHPNGREFLYAQQTEANPGLWLVDAATGHYRLLAHPAVLPRANLSGAAISPDGQVLAYSLAGPGIEQLWMANADGSDPHLVVDRGSSVVVDSWSPDGKYLLYRGVPIPDVGAGTPGPTSFALWMMDRQRESQRPLNMQRGPLPFIVNTAWSPTGQHIAGSGYTAQATSCGPSMNPSPDRLCPFRNRGVYVGDVETGEVWLVARDAIDPTWSPDGSMLAFVGMDEHEQVDVWLATIEDHSVRRLTDTPELDRYPIWLRRQW